MSHICNNLCFNNVTTELTMAKTFWKKLHHLMKSGRLSKVIKASGLNNSDSY